MHDDPDSPAQQYTVGEMTEIYLDQLADFILNEIQGNADDLELLRLLRNVMVPTSWIGLCDKLERCPVHICDWEICRDDEADCPSGKGQGWVRVNAFGQRLRDDAPELPGDRWVRAE